MKMNELGLSEPLLRAVTEMGFTEATPIQEAVIPFLLAESRDLIALAATGTGKTAAFGLPLLQRLIPSDSRIQTLVLCPTRELCRQISQEFARFSRFLPSFRMVSVYGGAAIGRQIQAIKAGAQVVVATPGRMKDLLQRGVADLSALSFLVLDEADEMLTMGFEEELRSILALTPDSKQTALFSATLSPRIASIAAGYLHHPEEISVGLKNQAAVTVEHTAFCVHAPERYTALRLLLDANPHFYGIVFCRTRQKTAELAAMLQSDGYPAEALHGDIAQLQRDAVMRRFRSGSIKILVATDVAARGIDVECLSHVVHYELPEDPEAYIHRSGRTGRVGREGKSVAVITPAERRRLPYLERCVHHPIELKPLPSFSEVLQQRLQGLAEACRVPSEEQPLSPEIRRAVDDAFDSVDRDALIQALISKTLLPLIAYYQALPPLKPVPVKPIASKAPRGGGHRPQSAPYSGGKRPFSGKRAAFSGEGSRTARFFCSLGKKDGISPKDIIGFINQTTGNRSIPIGQIELKPSFSFFEVESSYRQTVLQKSNGAFFKKRRVKVEPVNR